MKYPFLAAFRMTYVGSVMNRLMTARVLFALLFAVGAVFGGALAYAPYGLLPVSAYSDSTKLTVEFWKDRIKIRGASHASAEYRAFARAKGAILKHKLDHLYGAASYSVLGFEGITTCNYETDSGCLHEYFREAAKEFGSGALNELLKACTSVKEGSGQCIHSLGHGMLASYGYEKSDLLAALDGCTPIRAEDPLFGCDGGVFMEYNGYYLLDDVLKPRDPEIVGWYEPCEGVGAESMRSCVWWLIRWWSEYANDNPRYAGDDYMTMSGVLCQKLPWHRYERECFEAYGQSVAFIARWDPDTVKEACREATATEAQRLYCLSYAASMFITSDSAAPPAYGGMTSKIHLPTQDKAMAVCADLPTESRAYCEAYARNENYVNNELPLPPSVRS
jgi:hypothetical protein